MGPKTGGILGPHVNLELWRSLHPHIVEYILFKIYHKKCRQMPTVWWGLYQSAGMSNPNMTKCKKFCNMFIAHTAIVTFLYTDGFSLIPSSYLCSTFIWVLGLSKRCCSSLLSHYALLCCYPLHLQLPDVDFKVDQWGRIHLLAMSCKAAWMLPKSFSPCLTVSASASPACSLSASREARPAA